MRIHPDSWCALTPRWRFISWVTLSALLLLSATGAQLRTGNQQRVTHQAQQRRDAGINAGLWASVRKLAPPENMLSPDVLRPFSPLEFDTGELRMVRWQPDSRGGELVVEAVWAQIPSLFVTLAQRDVAVARFSIQPEQQKLQLVMQLERQDAG